MHHSRGELGNAQNMYMAAMQLDDGFAAPSFGLAQVFLARGDTKAAMTYAERAHKAYPNSVPVQRIYGHVRRAADAAAAVASGRGFHSSTSQINLSRFCHRQTESHPTYATKSAYVELKCGGVCAPGVRRQPGGGGRQDWYRRQPRRRDRRGRAVQLDTIKTRVVSAYGFSA